jgi:thiamine-phosphate pyrophosphorylase
VCLILDAGHLRVSAEVAAREAIDAGVRLFQYRDKNGTRRAIFEACRRLSVLLKRSNAVFIVNDHPDISLAVEANGVHLGQDDLPADEARRILGSGKIIGVSTHSTEQAMAAQSAGADYIGFGPLFPTRTKDAGSLQGIESLRQIRKAVMLPVIAIGGINIQNVGEAIAAGADGAAVISAVLSAADLRQAAREMVARIKRTQAPSFNSFRRG